MRWIVAPLVPSVEPLTVEESVGEGEVAVAAVDSVGEAKGVPYAKVLPKDKSAAPTKGAPFPGLEK